MLFTSKMRFFKIVLVASKKTTILDQLHTYLKFWGADVSCTHIY